MFHYYPYAHHYILKDSFLTHMPVGSFLLLFLQGPLTQMLDCVLNLLLMFKVFINTSNAQIHGQSQQ